MTTRGVIVHLRASRRRWLLPGLGITAGVVLIMISGHMVLDGLDDVEANNAAIRNTLAALKKNKGCYQAERRWGPSTGSGPLELSRYVETVSTSVGIEISESAEVARTRVGRLARRSVELRLRKVTLGQLVQFIKELEMSPQIVQVARLSVETRWRQHRDLDVTMVLATYDNQNIERDPRDRLRRS